MQGECFCMTFINKMKHSITSHSSKFIITKLIARFWDVDAGAVLVGGIDIREMSLKMCIRDRSYPFFTAV